VNIDFIVGDACSLDIKNNSINLILTSPPYSGIDPYRYGGDYRKQINNNKKKMVNLLIKSIKEMERVITDDGSIIINIGHQDYMPYHIISNIVQKTKLNLVNPPFIIKHEDLGKSMPEEKFKKSYSFWFHLSKSKNKFYNNHLLYKRHSDPIWDINWYDDSEVFNKLKETEFMLDSFNSEIARRFIKIFSNIGDTVLDPFGGTGVTAIESYKSGRNGISIDISPKQIELAKKRLSLEINK